MLEAYDNTAVEGIGFELTRSGQKLLFSECAHMDSTCTHACLYKFIAYGIKALL
jgi:hypothetical protein